MLISLQQSLCHDKMYLFYISTSSNSNWLPSNTYIIWLLITFFKTLNNVPNESDARGSSCNERVHNHARTDRETSVRYTTAGAATAMIPSTSSTPQQFVQFTSTHTCQSSDVWHVGIIRTQWQAHITQICFHAACSHIIETGLLYYLLHHL